MSAHEVREHLRTLNTVEGLRRLLIEHLNYAYRDQPLVVAEVLSEGVRGPVRSLRVVAGHRSFVVILCTVDRLRKADERPIAQQLMHHYYHALFVFTDPAHTAWHFCNLKHVAQEEDAAGRRARPFRRMVVGESERLRTVSEQLLEAAVAQDDTALSLHLKMDAAFDVEAVTDTFFADYRRIFEETEAQIEGLAGEALRLFTQRLFNRLLFLTFLERKGWLTFAGREDYLAALWEAHRAETAEGPDGEGGTFYRDRLRLLFFSGLNNPQSTDLMRVNQGGFLRDRIGEVPYLNGGLFERAPLDEREGVVVPDAVFGRILDDLLYHYNFTVTESTPMDVEVAVDPEMLGRIFEELVTGRHESGSYYTPKPVVAFMCREALKGYLRDICPREEREALAAFVDGRDASELGHPEAVLAALQGVRVCDPACGSGAYLVGMLHELVDLRQALFVTQGVDPRTAYEKKLEIIQRNLYGVDLDRFAVNIARLRLWLSLIVEYETDAAHPQPPPLPNLAFKVEVGDSLTGPAPGQLQPDLFHHRQVQDYFRLKGEFMTAHGPRKRSLREQIEALQAEISAWAGDGNEGGFDWAVQFAEIFTDQTPTVPGTRDVQRVPGTVGASGGTGFDVVLTNPPYVRQELLGAGLKETLMARYPQVYRGTADLYVYFYARALHLLREGGVASFISSNKWLRAGYGKKLRRHLGREAAVEAILDFGDLPLFAAAAYPMIIVFRNEPPDEDHTLRALEVEDLDVVDRLSETVRAEAWPQPQATLDTQRGWALVRPEVLALLEKLSKDKMQLEEYVDGEMYYGIKTGYNKAFVIDREIRDRLISEDPKSAEIIKPWIRGRNIDRWRIEWDGYFVLFTRRGIEIDEYPAVQKYLASFKKRLMPGTGEGRKPGNYEWYEIQDAVDYYAKFESPKIIYPDIAKHCEFTLDTEGFYGGNTTYFLPLDDLCLLGILNSRVLEFFFGHLSISIQHNYLRFFSSYMKQVPITEPTDAQRKAIEALVRKLLDAEGQGPHVEAWERELNTLVYEVYGLNDAEIAIIEEAVA